MSDRASSPTRAPVPPTQQKPETVDTEVRVKEEELLTLPSPTSTVAQTEADPEAPPSSPSRSIRRTEAQRHAVLLDDPQAQEVEPRRVLCRVCQKWIKLTSTTKYALANWQTHRMRCPGPVPAPRFLGRTPSKPNFSPGSRVATAERKIVLLNDPQVRACSPAHVKCGTCKSVVALEGEVDYDLTKWTEHKEKCIPMTPAPTTPQGSTSHTPRMLAPPSTSSTSADGSPRSPTPVGENSSNNSTETTAITESSPAAVKVGMKRSREEETEDGEREVAADERPANRARTETYKPPEGGPPSLLGWFIQPLKEFARGFREGLGPT